MTTSYWCMWDIFCAATLLSNDKNQISFGCADHYTVDNN